MSGSFPAWLAGYSGPIFHPNPLDPSKPAVFLPPHGSPTLHSAWTNGLGPGRQSPHSPHSLLSGRKDMAGPHHPSVNPHPHPGASIRRSPHLVPASFTRPLPASP